ncbi:MAG: Arginase/agmatinase/formiminoglutamase [Bacteroidetes bacterium]|uniref:arginase n=1 Tax=unclassified Chitinophaga TaxID=2619133 RepID=UPI0009C8BFE8|nr:MULTISPECIES: arginase [unclassified Chitinophaga]MBP1651211.1 Arginase/agmatinase/formiminoglutamase [Bacteroidota bacterium]OMP77263.1 arginase [[Flexibacter] sp. ATCC 35208]WPV66501.1 arginase [Chitinophaga sp. LS1]
MKNIKIIEVKSEIGAGTRGASLGVEAIKIAALDFMSNFFVHFPTETIETENKLLFEPIESPYAKRIKGTLTLYERISKSVCETVKANWFPVVLSGDHSTAGATIAGLKMARPKAKIGAIWIDAHADLHTPYTTPSGNMHGMPVAISIAEDNLECKVHDLDDNTIKQWEALKNIGGIAPKVLPEDIVFISLRDYEKEEEALIKQYGMKVITTNEVRRKGAEQVARAVFRYLSDCEYIYVSFDVDSLDSSISKGTGTPVTNGLREREVEDLIAKFMQHRKICCFEITEVNPTLDKENLMAEIAFNILQRSVNVLLMN